MSKRGVGLGMRVRDLKGTPAARIAAITVVACALLAGFLIALLRSDAQTRPVLFVKPITVTRELSTTAALFGDRIEAEVDVYTDDRRIAPGSVRVRPDFRPYKAVTTRIDRESRDSVSLLRSRITLTCLTQVCVPPLTGGVALHFRPFTVFYRLGGQTKSGQVAWQPIQILSRLPLDPAARIGVADTAPPLEAGFPRSPTLLRMVLLLAATILALAGSALVVTSLWRTSFYARYRSRRRSPLERVLHEVEAAAQLGDETQRRSALDQLATRLAELPSPSFEARTRSLAWGAAKPEPEMLTLLAEQVRTSLNGGSRR
jgi:hypothetical protein